MSPLTKTLLENPDASIRLTSEVITSNLVDTAEGMFMEMDMPHARRVVAGTPQDKLREFIQSQVQPHHIQQVQKSYAAWVSDPDWQREEGDTDFFGNDAVFHKVASHIQRKALSHFRLLANRY